jgi:hypothetical protein
VKNTHNLASCNVPSILRGYLCLSNTLIARTVHNIIKLKYQRINCFYVRVSCNGMECARWVDITMYLYWRTKNIIHVGYVSILDWCMSYLGVWGEFYFTVRTDCCSAHERCSLPNTISFPVCIHIFHLCTQLRKLFGTSTSTVMFPG